MYKVYGPRQTKLETSNELPNGLPQKRVRLVHPANENPQAATRAARLSWTDETDTHLGVPDFLLSQEQARESRRRPGQIGLGIIFATTFLLSFCGVFLVAHFFQADTGSLLSKLQVPQIAALFAPETEADPSSLSAVSSLSGENDVTEPVTVAQPAVTEPAQPVVVAQNTATLDLAVQSDVQVPAVGSQSAGLNASVEGSRTDIANVEATGAASNPGLMPTMIAIDQGRYIVPTTKPGDKEPQLMPIELDAYKIATTEVTRGQWQACVAAGACSDAGFPEQYFQPNKLPLPVTSVTTAQMQGFIAWINTKRSPGEPAYRLPLEAEWIVAARGGTNGHSQFAWGGAYDAEQIRSSDMMLPVDHSKSVHGLFGMSDNAAERVSGCWIMRMSDGNCYRNLGVVRGPLPGRINEQSVSLNHRTSRATNIPYQNIGFRLAQ